MIQNDVWVFFLDTSVPCFLKICITPLDLCERPTLVPVSAKRKKSKEDFHFYRKIKNSTQRLFGSKPLWRRHAPRAARVALPSPPPPRRPLLSVLSSSYQSCELCVCALSWVNFVLLLARCVLRCQTSLGEVIFWGLGTLKCFPHKLVAVALLYTISA